MCAFICRDPIDIRRQCDAMPKIADQRPHRAGHVRHERRRALGRLQGLLRAAEQCGEMESRHCVDAAEERVVAIGTHVGVLVERLIGQRQRIDRASLQRAHPVQDQPNRIGEPGVLQLLNQRDTR